MTKAEIYRTLPQNTRWNKNSAPQARWNQISNSFEASKEKAWDALFQDNVDQETIDQVMDDLKFIDTLVTTSEPKFPMVTASVRQKVRRERGVADYVSGFEVGFNEEKLVNDRYSVASSQLESTIGLVEKSLQTEGSVLTETASDGGFLGTGLFATESPAVVGLEEAFKATSQSLSQLEIGAGNVADKGLTTWSFIHG